MFIEELNLPIKIRLADDPRIDKVEFDSEALEITASLCLISNKQKKKEKWLAGIKHKKTDLEEESEPEPTEPVPLKLNVFDRVKIRVDTTEEFPLDIKATLMFSKED
jgi:hypothetical protein